MFRLFSSLRIVLMKSYRSNNKSKFKCSRFKSNRFKSSRFKSNKLNNSRYKNSRSKSKLDKILSSKRNFPKN